MKIGPFEPKSVPTPVSSERKTASAGRSETASSTERGELHSAPTFQVYALVGGSCFVACVCP